jgi:hypothetical protein
MTITYGGIPLGQPSPAVAAFVDAHPMDLQKPANFERTAFTQAQEERFQKVRLNHLYWPVGATRWAHAECLANQRTIRDLRLMAYTSASPNRFVALPFTMDDGMGGTLTTSLYMLPPRPLNTMAGGEFWLLELVDARFFWWEVAANISIDEGTTTWAQLIAAIGTALGITITLDTISPAYLTPAASLVEPYAPLPVLLDLAVQAIGHRLIRNLSGAVRTQTPTTARTAQNAQLATAMKRAKAAGGSFSFDATRANDLPGRVPASVTVTFPRTDNDVPSLVPYAITKTLTGLAISEYGPTIGHAGTKIIPSTAVARFLATVLVNPGELDLAARVIAEDWYRWQLAKVNARYDGIYPWPADGFTDHIEWSSLPGAASTRVQRPEENALRLHQSGSENVSIIYNPTIVYDVVNNVLKVYNSVTNVWVSFCPCDPPPPDSCVTVDCCPDYCIPLILCVTSINEDCGSDSSNIPPDFTLTWNGSYWYGESTFGDFVYTFKLECIDGAWRFTMTITAGRAVHEVQVWEAGDLTIDCGPPLSIQAPGAETYGGRCTLDWSIDVCTTGETVTVGCCEDPVAATLHAHLDAVSGASCLNDVDIDLPFVPGSGLYGGGEWTGVSGTLGCGSIVCVRVLCAPTGTGGFHWEFALVCCAPGTTADVAFVPGNNTMGSNTMMGTNGSFPTNLDTEQCGPVELSGVATMSPTGAFDTCTANGDTVRITITE